jgi:hypothetical protein
LRARFELGVGHRIEHSRVPRKAQPVRELIHGDRRVAHRERKLLGGL